MEIFDDSISVGSGFSRARAREQGRWIEGEVATPFGFVSVYAQGDDSHYYCTRLDFIHNGTMHMRTFKNKRYTPRGIVTKAKQFAREIKESQQ